MVKKISNEYAPEETCKNCGFTGKDWGFKYHYPYCTKCYDRWKKKQSLSKKAGRINENIKITDDVIVTTNVKNRLEKKAGLDIPISKKYKVSNILFYVGAIIFLVTILYILISGDSSSWILILAGIGLANIFVHVFDYFMNRESGKRKIIVDEHTIELAKERKKQLEEARKFYTSPEWKLLRKQIIQANENVCKNCGKIIIDKNDITIDHILPRSKFPQNALEMKNMQILCRSCNSSKGNKIINLINT